MRTVNYIICLLITISQLAGEIPTVYNRELGIRVPLYPTQIQSEWKYRKNKIAKRIGKITPMQTEESDSWKNSAKSIDELFQDAVNTAPYFQKQCEEVAKTTGCRVYFGKYALVKTKQSITQKVDRIARKHKIAKPKAIGKIRDAIRATLIVKTPEQVSSVVEAIKKLSASKRTKVVFHQNDWESERKDGYIGIHSSLLLPVRDEAGNQKKNKAVIAELQIHLECITNGTLECPKERAHLLYEKVRDDSIENKEIQAASTLMFLEGLQRCPEAPQSVNSKE